MSKKLKAGQGKYICSICGRGFASGPGLGGHIGKVHPKSTRINKEDENSKETGVKKPPA